MKALPIRRTRRRALRLFAATLAALGFAMLAALAARAASRVPNGTHAGITHHVPADFATIQGAIAASGDGDTVEVAPGTYVENLDFLGKNIVVRGAGGFASAALVGDGANPVVTFAAGETRAAVLSGFDIMNGSGTSSSTSYGGGISISNASPTIRLNRIRECSAPAGGGIGCVLGSPLVEFNEVRNNSANSFGGGVAIAGTSDAVLFHNRIEFNTATTGSGGIDLSTAGVTRIELNVIAHNTATSGAGGGIGSSGASNPIVTGNEISSNSADHGGGIAWQVLPPDPGPTVSANTFAANSATLGSAIYADGFDSDVLVTGNVLVGPATTSAVHVASDFDTETPQFRANLFWSAGSSPFGGILGDLTGVNGNLVASPQFVNAGAEDFHVGPLSPAVDAGDDAAPALALLDLDGHARILDGNNDGQAHVDIGAFENLTPAPVNHPPVAVAGGPYAGTVGAPVAFSGAGSSDPDGDLITFAWDFGDGTTSTAVSPVHTYAQAGVYAVQLAVSDGPLSNVAVTSAAIDGPPPPDVFAATAFVLGGDRTTRLGSGRPLTCISVQPVKKGFAIGDVDLASVRLRIGGKSGGQSIASLPEESALGRDRNHDGIAELEVCFAKDDLRQLFETVNGAQSVPVVVSGALPGNASFEAEITLDVVNSSYEPIVLARRNGQAEMSFETPTAGPVRLQLFDVSGRRLATPVDERWSEAGAHTLSFALNGEGRSLVPGLYFYRAETTAGVFRGKMILVR